MLEKHLSSQGHLNAVTSRLKGPVVTSSRFSSGKENVLPTIETSPREYSKARVDKIGTGKGIWDVLDVRSPWTRKLLPR